MSDPFREARPGEPLVLPATAWNTVLDAAKAESDRRHGRGFDPADQIRSGEIVRVLNTAGADLTRNSVVGLDAPIFTPTQSVDAFLRGVAMRSVVPTADHKGRFVVLLEPAPQGRVVRAHAAGVCQVRVNVTDAAHKRADVEPGRTDRLISDPDGSAPILWREGGTGEQWAVVALDIPCCEGETEPPPTTHGCGTRPPQEDLCWSYGPGVTEGSYSQHSGDLTYHFGQHANIGTHFGISEYDYWESECLTGFVSGEPWGMFRFVLAWTGTNQRLYEFSFSGTENCTGSPFMFVRSCPIPASGTSSFWWRFLNQPGPYDVLLAQNNDPTLENHFYRFQECDQVANPLMMAMATTATDDTLVDDVPRRPGSLADISRKVRSCPYRFDANCGCNSTAVCVLGHSDHVFDGRVSLSYCRACVVAPTRMLPAPGL